MQPSSVRLLERFLDRVEKFAEPCWVWRGRRRDSKGYGAFDVGRVAVQSHRFAYERLVGPVPSGLELDHLCRNPACVNPAHLEPVTHAENMRRGVWSPRKHCVAGHEYTAANTITKPNGHRHCRSCHNERRRRARARKAGAR